MKYCPRCGEICSDASENYDQGYCDICGYEAMEEDDMTSEKYDRLTEEQKDEYDLQLVKKITSSSVYRGSNSMTEYGTADFYYDFRFDRYEEMTGRRANRKLTPEEREARAKRRRAKLDEAMKKYGPGTPYYEEEQRREAVEKVRQALSESEHVPRCPICQSTNLKKLSKFSFMNSFGVNMNDGGIPSVFPVFGMKPNDKTWKCNHCGSKF